MRPVVESLVGRFFNHERDPSQEIMILREAEKFRSFATKAWDSQTIYPGYEYVEGSSQGQCGVTNFGFGIWLSWQNIVPTRQMFFEESRIKNATGKTVGEHHSCLCVTINDLYSANPLPMRFDFAADQFVGIDSPMVVQYDDYFYRDPTTKGGSIVYIANSITPLPNYDVNRFNGRLDRFMRNVGTVAYPGGLPSGYEGMLSLVV